MSDETGKMVFARARASEMRWLAAGGSGPLRRTCALQTPREEKKTEESGASSAEHVEREQQSNLAKSKVP